MLLRRYHDASVKETEVAEKTKDSSVKEQQKNNTRKTNTTKQGDK